MALSDVVQEVMALSRAADEYWDRELPKRHPNYPLVNEGEDSGPPPEEEKKLEELMEHLPEDVIWQLALIVDVAFRGFKTQELPGIYTALKRRLETPRSAVRYLFSSSPLDDYLSEGLAELKKNGIDLNALPEKIAA